MPTFQNIIWINCSQRGQAVVKIFIFEQHENLLKVVQLSARFQWLNKAAKWFQHLLNMNVRNIESVRLGLKEIIRGKKN